MNELMNALSYRIRRLVENFIKSCAEKAMLNSLQCKVLVVTSNFKMSRFKQLLVYGVDEYLVKPISALFLTEILQTKNKS